MFRWRGVSKKSNNYFLQSFNYEMYLQEVRKSTFSNFDDERNYLSNIKSSPWNLKIWFCILILFKRKLLVYIYFGT